MSNDFDLDEVFSDNAKVRTWEELSEEEREEWKQIQFESDRDTFY